MNNIQAKAILEKEKLWESNERVKTAFDIAIKALETVDKITPCYLGSPCEYQTEDVNHNHDWIACTKELPPQPKPNPEFEGKSLELYLVSTNDSKYPWRAFWNGKDFTDGWRVVYPIAWQQLPKRYMINDLAQKG